MNRDKEYHIQKRKDALNAFNILFQSKTFCETTKPGSRKRTYFILECKSSQVPIKSLSAPNSTVRIISHLPTCTKCHVMGHTRFNCPKNSCIKCGKSDHKGNECKIAKLLQKQKTQNASPFSNTQPLHRNLLPINGSLDQASQKFHSNLEFQKVTSGAKPKPKQTNSIVIETNPFLLPTEEEPIQDNLGPTINYSVPILVTPKRKRTESPKSPHTPNDSPPSFRPRKQGKSKADSNRPIETTPATTEKLTKSFSELNTKLFNSPTKPTTKPSLIPTTEPSSPLAKPSSIPKAINQITSSVYYSADQSFHQTQEAVIPPDKEIERIPDSPPPDRDIPMILDSNDSPGILGETSQLPLSK